MKFTKNLGTFDRVARIAVGAVLVLLLPLAFVGPDHAWALIGLLGVVPLAAGLTGYCPPYAVMGVNTRTDDSRLDDRSS